MADYSELKSKFKTGDIPTGDDYGELIQLAGDAKDKADGSVTDNGDGSITINSKKVTPASINNVVIDNKDNTITVNNKVYAPVIDNQDGTITVNTQRYTPADYNKVVIDNKDNTITVNEKTYTPVSDNKDDTITVNGVSYIPAKNSQLVDINNKQRAVVSMSITVTKASNNSRFGYYLNRSKNNQNMDFTLVDMVNINDKNDYNPTPLSDGEIISAISDIQNAGKRVVMLKPHLGIGYSDGFSRSDYVPSDHDMFFSNWKKILLNHAKICSDNSVPVLSLGCEQVDQFTDTYYNKWVDIVNAIRQAYPKVKLTIASNSWRDKNSHKIFGLLDYIGCNWYPTYDYTHYEDESDMTWDISDTQVMLSGGGNMNRPNLSPVTEWSQLCGLVHDYHKPLWITEIGVVSKLNGLTSILPDGYDDNTSHYYKPVAIAMQSAIPFLSSQEEVWGVSWWHCFEPFNYAPEGATNYTPTYAEQEWDKEVSEYGYKY